MTNTWKIESDQFIADYKALKEDNAKVRELLVSHLILKKAVSQFLACLFDKGESKFMLRCFDVCDLIEAYRRACYYDD